jgi:hypothetical protein
VRDISLRFGISIFLTRWLMRKDLTEICIAPPFADENVFKPLLGCINVALKLGFDGFDSLLAWMRIAAAAEHAKARDIR